ncbi:MAG: HpcH/HpaI aldolase/citrate lyase family protein, partial [Propioniciclava sp.]
MSPPIRTALYVPGSSPRMMAKADTLAVDAVILDLEDAVSPAEKGAARDGVAQHLLAREGNHQRWVRINAVGSADQVADLAAVLPARPEAIVVPKATPEALRVVAGQVRDHASSPGTPAPGLVALVETAEGLLHVGAVAASPGVVAVQLGAEDLTADLGIARTPTGEEILLARHQVALAARAHRLAAIDTPFLDIADTAALSHDCRAARQCGMTAKTCIHPSQL